jgi:hypothetical protein
VESLLTLTALKKVTPFLPTSQLQSCLPEIAEQTGEYHAACAILLPTSWENNPVQPLGRLNLSPSKTKKHKQQTII